MLQELMHSYVNFAQESPRYEEYQKSLQDCFRNVMLISVSRTTSVAPTTDAPAEDLSLSTAAIARAASIPDPLTPLQQDPFSENSASLSVDSRSGSNRPRSGSHYSEFSCKYHEDATVPGNRAFKLVRAAILTQPLLVEFLETATRIPTPRAPSS